MTRLPAYILAGGKSSRFGADKAMADFGGQPLIVHIAASMRAICGNVTVIADSPDKYASLGLPTQSDRLRERGPLGGLHAALGDQIERFGPGWILVVSCDLAGLKCEWVETIVRLVDLACSPASKVAGTDPNAVAFRGDFWQPFPAAIHTSIFPALCRLLESGSASFQKLLSDPRLHVVPVPLPDDWPKVVQANTPAELDRIRDNRMNSPD